MAVIVRLFAAAAVAYDGILLALRTLPRNSACIGVPIGAWLVFGP